MGERTKEKLLGLVVIAVLVTLIVVRLSIKSDQTTWISFFNYVGLVVAIVALYIEIQMELSNKKKFDIVTGCFVLIVVSMTIFAALIFSEVVTLSTKSNDIILLITLLITLPTRLYKSILADVLDD